MIYDFSENLNILQDSMIVAVVYFLTPFGDVEAKFSIQSEPLQWFYLGEMETETVFS